MSESSENPRVPARGFGLSTQIVLATIPVVGYLFAFALKFGWLHSFGVPFVLVDVQVVDVALGSVVAGALLMSVFWGLDFLPEAPWWALPYTLWPPFGFLLMAYLILPVVVGGSIPLAIAAGLGTFVLVRLAVHSIWQDLVQPIRTRQGRVLNRLREHILEEISRSRPSLAISMATALHKQGIPVAQWQLLFFCTVWVPAVLLFLIGEWVGSHKRAFLTIQTGSPCMILGQSDGSFLCAELGGADESLPRRYRLVPQAGVSVEWTRRALGASLD